MDKYILILFLIPFLTIKYIVNAVSSTILCESLFCVRRKEEMNYYQQLVGVENLIQDL